VNVSLRAGGGLRGYKVGDCRFASASAVVPDGDGVHAGDFLASLSCEGEYRGDLLLRHLGVGGYPTVNFVATGARAVPVSRVCHDPGAVVGWTNTIHPPPFKLECIGADKIPILVVCLASYSDDFNVRRQQKASHGGVYIRCCHKYRFQLRVRYIQFVEFEYECWPPISLGVSIRNIP